MADDQGKGKIVPRKGLFVQEHDFLSSIPSWDTFFSLCREVSTNHPKIGEFIDYLMDTPYSFPVMFPITEIMDAPSVQEFLQFSKNKLMDAPSFQEFP